MIWATMINGCNLTLHFHKTKCLRCKNGSQLYLHNGSLCFEKQSSETDLGVIIDNRLNVSCLCNVTKRTNEILECGGGVVWSRNNEGFHHVWVALPTPRLGYWILSRCLHFKEDLKTLDRAQVSVTSEFSGFNRKTQEFWHEGWGAPHMQLIEAKV